jgi:hypothetical protein
MLSQWHALFSLQRLNYDAGSGNRQCSVGSRRSGWWQSFKKLKPESCKLTAADDGSRFKFGPNFLGAVPISIGQLKKREISRGISSFRGRAKSFFKFKNVLIYIGF